MSPDQFTLLKRRVLRVLDDCAGLLLSEPELLTQVRLAGGVPPSVGEFRAALDALEVQSAIAGLTPELGPPRKWRITDQGRAILLNCA